MWRTVILAAAVCSACLAIPAQDTTHSDNELEGLTECLRKDSTTCLKYKFFSFVDKMIGQKDTFSLAEGVTVIRATDTPVDAGAPRSMDPLARLKNYLDTHSVRVELKGSDVVEAVNGVGRALEDSVSAFTEDNEVEEGRGKKKKAQKIMGPIMAAMAMKMMALLPVAIAAIAVIAGKALLVGKLALVLSAIIGLKKLLSQQKHVTYEVVAHPHHSSSHSSGHDYAGGGTSGYGGDSSGGYGGGGGGSGHASGGWGRSIDGQTLAYSAQKPQ